jgi:hypothetical protein
LFFRWVVPKFTIPTVAAYDMSDLLMPSDLKPTAAPGSDAPKTRSPGSLPPVPEPPSLKLVVRLFLIPLLIAAAVIGIMVPVGWMAGGKKGLDAAINDLKQPGGQRTGGMLVGPAAKQRYIDAKTIVDNMKAGLTEAERIKLAKDLIEIVDLHSSPEEGEIQHLLLLALGRVWQVDPTQPPMDSPQAVESRRAVVKKLEQYADAPRNATADHIPLAARFATRKAALLAMVYLAGRDEVRDAFPTLKQKLADGKEDLDVRMAAATVLGPLAKPTDQDVIDALRSTWRGSDGPLVELGWDSALSLAQLHDEQVAGTLLMLMDRKELADRQVFDREGESEASKPRNLTPEEIERFMINAMLAAKSLKDPSIRQRFEDLKAHDPSSRVREAATEILREH